MLAGDVPANWSQTMGRERKVEQNNLSKLKWRSEEAREKEKALIDFMQQVVDDIFKARPVEYVLVVAYRNNEKHVTLMYDSVASACRCLGMPSSWITAEACLCEC